VLFVITPFLLGSILPLVLHFAIPPTPLLQRISGNFNYTFCIFLTKPEPPKTAKIAECESKRCIAEQKMNFSGSRHKQTYVSAKRRHRLKFIHPVRRVW
jgi:hypothetical protein